MKIALYAQWMRDIVNVMTPSSRSLYLILVKPFQKLKIQLFKRQYLKNHCRLGYDIFEYNRSIQKYNNIKLTCYQFLKTYLSTLVLFSIDLSSWDTLYIIYVIKFYVEKANNYSISNMILNLEQSSKFSVAHF